VVGAAEVWIILIGGGAVVAHLRPDLGSSGPWAFAAAFVICIGITLYLRWWWGRWEHLDVIGREEATSSGPESAPAEQATSSE
jgi:hypothetical protein